MRNDAASRCAKYFAPAALGLAIATGVAAAPQSDEVVVEIARPGLHRDSSLGAPVNIITLTRRVSVSDLDLRSYSGWMQLETRVNETANTVCDQLHRRYHLSLSERRSCVRDAVAGGIEQARAAIAAAEERIRKAQLTSSN